MASPLASIFSKVDSAKRSLLDILTNPVESAQQIVGNANDRAGVLNQLTGQVAGQTRDSIKAGGSLMPDTPESQQLTQMMADAYNPVGMTVFHGSPYKFNAFAPKSIGSGEGAQAYGYGHYVAESPEVAKGYANRLGVMGATDQAGNQFGKYELASFFSDGLIAKGIPKDAAKSQSLLWADKFTKGESLNNPIALDIINSKGLNAANGGSFYKIDLPDEQIAKMLDWDAEIGKQAPEVQALAKQFGINADDLGGDLVAAMGAKKAAGAEQMRLGGIPGIRYYDAQSRGGQKADTRNFVVFPQNEGLLNILERNGVPLK